MSTSRFLTYVSFLVFLLLHTSAWASFEQCSTPSQAIPDNNTTGISDSITITDTTIGVIKAVGISQLDLVHGNVGELTFKLSNSNRTVVLMETPDKTADKLEGCVGKDFGGTEISDDGTDAIQTSCKEDQPAYGSSDFTPKESLSVFTGDDAADTWTLTVIDNNEYGTGTLNKWCVKYTVNSSATVTIDPSEGTTLDFDGSLIVAGNTKTDNLRITETTGLSSLVIERAEFTGSDKADFKLTSHHITNDFARIITPGNSETYTISCEPSGRGTHSATFHLYTNLPAPSDELTYPLTCEGIGAGYNDNGQGGTINFGDVDLNTASASETITITEEGDAGQDLKITEISKSGSEKNDFSITGIPSLPHTIGRDSGDSLTLGISCTPSEVGERTAKLTIKTNDPDNSKNEYNLKCTGKGAVYKSIPAADSTVNFGKSQLGTSSTRNITVSNEGNETLTVSNVEFSDTGDGSAAKFSLSISLGLDIPAGGSGNLPIECSSDTAGSYTATISVAHNGLDSPTQYTVSCETSSVAIPEYASNPIIASSISMDESVDIGATTQGNLYIYETGTDTLTVDLTDSDNPFGISDDADVFSILSPTFPISIADGDVAQQVVIQCAPKHKGTHTATLSLTHNGATATNPATYTVTCEGKAPVYTNKTITIGGTLVIGEETVGSTIENKYQVKNTGDARLEVDNMTISGTHASDFKLKDPSDGDYKRDAGAQRWVKVQCTPSSVGLRTAKLNVKTNDPEYPTINYTLECTGERPIGAGYGSTPSPNSLVEAGTDIGEIKFDAVSVDSTSSKTLTIAEVGTAVLKVYQSSSLISGDNASDFAIANDLSNIFDETDGGFHIADGSGKTVTLNLTCTPSAEGTRTAYLNLTSNGKIFTNPTYKMTCEGLQPAYDSDPANTIDFGNSDIGVKTTQTLTISEIGTDTLTVNLATNPITGTNAGDFAIEDTSTFPISIADGGDSVDVELSCTPSGEGSRSATLNLTSNDPDKTNISYKFNCSGNKKPVVDNPTDETPQAPSIPQRKLTIQFEGNGLGTITTVPNNVACSNHGVHDQCVNEYIVDAKLQLIPTPRHDSYFVGWSNNCQSENITLSDDKTCVATFELLPTYTLNVLVIGEGEVNSTQYPNFNCHSEKVEKCFINDLIQATTVNLQPTPLDGWSFAGWEADCDNNGQVLMTSDKACHAIFEPNTTEKVKFSVSIRSGSGTVISDSVPELTCQNNTGSCAGDYNINTIMGVMAIADAPYIFAGWNGDCSDAGKSATHSLQLTKPESHCIADFILPPPDPVEQPQPDNTETPNDSETSDDPQEELEEEQPKIKCLTEGRLNYACHAEGETVKDLKVLPTGSISNIVVEGNIDNQGWVSDSHVKSGGKISGGTLTGQIKLEDGGILENVILKGDLIEGGTLRGEIRNESPVGGVIKNVLLDDNAVIKGGYVNGTIEGNPADICQPTARLQNVIVLHNTVLNNVVIGEGVKFGNNVVFGDCVVVADGSIYRPDQDEIDENGTVHLAKDSYVSDGELNGDFVGDDEGLPLLENVLIAEDSTVDNVILGQDVVNHGKVTNFELRGIDFRGGTIGGEIDVTRGGTIEDVTLAPDTVIDGGNFKGNIVGDPESPATIKNGFINADACISNVVLAEGTMIAEGACIGENVLDEEPEQKPEEAPEIENMLQVEPNGEIKNSEATFDPRVAVCDIPRTNNTLLSKRDAKGVELKAHIGVDPIHQGLPGEMLMVARHNFHNSITDMMKLPDGSWTSWHQGMEIVGFQTFDALPEGIDTFVFQGDLGEVRGEISVFMGYRLTDGTTVYNGGEPLRVFIDTTPDTCLVYAIHDEGLNETQPVVIDLSVGLDGDMRLLGTERRFYGYDIEGMELHPDDDNLLLGTGGDDSNVYGKEQDGHLYTIDKTTGHIEKIGRIVSSDGSIEFEQVAGIALHPVTKQLWGWGIVNRKDKFMAILHIDHNTGVARIHKQFEHNQVNNVTGLTWSRDGHVMFMSSEDRLWRYNPNTQEMKVKCEGISDQVIDFLKARNDEAQLKLIGYKKGEIEGLDIQPNGWLLIGIDYQASTASSIVAYDAETCEVKQIQTFRNSVFHDLESVVWPVKACNDQSWLNEDPCAEFNE